MSGSILAQKAPISCDTGSSFYVNFLTFVISPISLDDYKTFQKTKHYYLSISLNKFFALLRNMFESLVHWS